jgi:hypothetical protein
MREKNDTYRLRIGSRRGNFALLNPNMIDIRVGVRYGCFAQNCIKSIHNIEVKTACPSSCSISKLFNGCRINLISNEPAIKVVSEFNFGPFNITPTFRVYL